MIPNSVKWYAVALSEGRWCVFCAYRIGFVEDAGICDLRSDLCRRLCLDDQSWEAFVREGERLESIVQEHFHP